MERGKGAGARARDRFRIWLTKGDFVEKRRVPSAEVNDGREERENGYTGALDRAQER